MRNLKKILALVLALMMVLSVMVTASAASPLEKFEDAEAINPAYEQAVEVMVAAGILNGMDADTFAPTGTLTRAQAAKLIAYVDMGPNAAKLPARVTKFVEDVPATYWASGFIAYCTGEGIINGMTETSYDPEGALTVQAYAKMLLCVLGVEGTYTGDYWYIDAINNATEKGLVAGMNVTNWEAELTREEACQMTFNAMKIGSKTETKATEAKYTVTITDNKGTAEDKTDDVVATYDFATAADAYFFATAKKDEQVPNVTVATAYVPAGTTTQTTGLMANFKISVKTAAEGGKDAYGRPALVYTIDKGVNEKNEKVEVVLAYAETPVDIYYTAMDADAIEAAVKALTDAKYTVTSKVTFTEDGVSKAGDYYTAGVATTLQYETGNNVVVELYANNDDKVIDTAVITNTYFAAAGNVVPADNTKTPAVPEKVYIGETLIENELGLFKGEYVTYTLCNGEIENLAKADYIINTLTSYNSKTNSYTIDGTAYTLDNNVSLDATTIAAMFKDAHVFYVGANNTIVNYAKELPTAGTTTTPGSSVPTNYAIIEAAAAKVVTGTVAGDLWEKDVKVVTDVLAQVKAYTNDGSYGVYDLEVTKAADAIKDEAGKVLVAKDAWYIMVGETYYPLAVAVDTKAEDLAKEIEGILVGALNVYPYAVEDGVITLYAKLPSLTGSETVSGTYVKKLRASASISASSLTITCAGGHIALINENTTFLLGYDTDDTKQGVEEYKNTTALAGTLIENDDTIVVVNVTVAKDKDGKVTGQTNVAEHVFAQADTYDAGKAPVVPAGTEMVYVNAADYVLTEMGKETNTYIYNVVKTDGTTAQLKYVAAAPLNKEASGIYLLKTDGTLDSKVSGQTQATVGVISGTTVQLSNTYKVVNDTTTVVGDLSTGDTVLYILYTVENQPTNVVKLIFVTTEAK